MDLISIKLKIHGELHGRINFFLILFIFIILLRGESGYVRLARTGNGAGMCGV